MRIHSRIIIWTSMLLIFFPGEYRGVYCGDIGTVNYVVLG